jgi:hypothetical protein
MAGIGDSWGTADEIAHPRDSHGRWRSKWKLDPAAFKAVIAALGPFSPRTFQSDGQATQYTQNLAHSNPGRFQGGKGYARLITDFHNANNDLLDGNADEPSTKKYVEMMDQSMIDTPEDMIVSAVVGPDAFGLTPERLSEIENLTNTVIANRGYQAGNLGTPQGGGQGQITMSIATPKGTKMAFPGTAPTDRSAIFDRDQELTVTKVKPDGRGGYYVWAVATPKTAGDNPPPVGGHAGPGHSGDREADVKALEDVRMKRDMGEQGESQLPGGRAAGGLPEDASGKVIKAPPGETEQDKAQRERATRRAAVLGRPASTPEPAAAPAAAPEAPAAPTPTPEAPAAPVPAPASTPAPSGVEVPAGATSVVTGNPAESFRDALTTADLPAPSKMHRQEFNDAINGISSGKRAPQDVLRDLDSDIESAQRSQDLPAAEQGALDTDVERMQNLAELIRKHFSLGEPKHTKNKKEVRGEIRAKEAARSKKNASPGGGSDRKPGEAPGSAAAKALETARGGPPRKTAPAPKTTQEERGDKLKQLVETNASDDAANAAQRSEWSAAVGKEPKELQGTAADILLDETADLLRNGRVTRPKAVARLRDAARDTDTGPEHDYLRKVADLIEADTSKPNKRVPLKKVAKKAVSTDTSEKQLEGRTARNILTGVNGLDVGNMRALAEKWGVETRGEDGKLKLKAALAKDLAAKWKDTPELQKGVPAAKPAKALKAAKKAAPTVPAAEDLPDLAAPELKAYKKLRADGVGREEAITRVISGSKRGYNAPGATALATPERLDELRTAAKARKASMAEISADTTPGMSAFARKGGRIDADTVPKTPAAKKLAVVAEAPETPPVIAKAAAKAAKAADAPATDVPEAARRAGIDREELDRLQGWGREIMAEIRANGVPEDVGPSDTTGVPEAAQRVGIDREELDRLQKAGREILAEMRAGKKPTKATPAKRATPAEAIEALVEAVPAKKAAPEVGARTRPRTTERTAYLSDVATYLRSADDEDEARFRLSKLLGKDLDEVAAQTGVFLAPRATKKQKVDTLVRENIQRRKASDTISRPAPVALEPDAVFERLQSFDNPPSRAEARDLVAGLKRSELVDLATRISVPGAKSKSAKDLRLDLVEGTAGRRLDSIATRGFTGENPFSDPLPGIPEGPAAIRAQVKATKGPGKLGVEDRVAVHLLAKIQDKDPAMADRVLADMPDKDRARLEEAADLIKQEAKRVKSGGPDLAEIMKNGGIPEPKKGTPEANDREVIKGLLDAGKVPTAQARTRRSIRESEAEIRASAKDIASPDSTAASRAAASANIERQQQRLEWLRGLDSAFEGNGAISLRVDGKSIKRMEIDQDLAQAIKDASVDDLRESARLQGVKLPESATTKDEIMTEVIREIARRQLAGKDTSPKLPDAPPAKPEPTLPKASNNIKGDTTEGHSYRETLKKLESGDLTPAAGAKEMRASAKYYRDQARSTRDFDMRGRTSPEAKQASIDRNLEIAAQYDDAAKEFAARKRVAKQAQVQAVLADVAAQAVGAPPPAKKATKKATKAATQAVQEDATVQGLQRMAEGGFRGPATEPVSSKGFTGDAAAVARIVESSRTPVAKKAAPSVGETLARATKTTPAKATTPGASKQYTRDDIMEMNPGEVSDVEEALGIKRVTLNRQARADAILAKQQESGAPTPAKKAASAAPPAPTAPEKYKPVTARNVPTPQGRITTPPNRETGDEPFKPPNGGSDQGLIHLDSDIGQLWQNLTMDDRVPNSFVNEIAALGDDMGRQKLTLQQVLDRLREMQGEAPDKFIADRIRETVDNLTVPAAGKLDLPEGMPKTLRDALTKLSEIPTARIKATPKERTRVGATVIGEDSVLEKKMAAIRQLMAGEGSTFEIVQALRKRDFHESVDAAPTMWSIMERALADKAVEKWIRETLRAARAKKEE